MKAARRRMPARSPNLNAYAERWVRSVKEECLSKVILFGELNWVRAYGTPLMGAGDDRRSRFCLPSIGTLTLRADCWLGEEGTRKSKL